MATEEMYTAKFVWPYTDPRDVIVTGDFDRWTSSHHLSRVPHGFEVSIGLPWGKKVAYKFIVDGRWTISPAHPTEMDPIGNVNNFLVVPEKPAPPPAKVSAPAVEPVKETEPVAAPAAASTTDEKPQNGSASPPAPSADADAAPADHSETTSISGIASNVAAGTSSALGMLASGIGAAIQGVTGFVPVDVDKVAAGESIFPPMDTPREDSTPADLHTAEPNSEAPNGDPKPGSGSGPEPELAPIVPIEIMPINEAENSTGSDSAVVDESMSVAPALPSGGDQGATLEASVIDIVEKNSGAGEGTGGIPSTHVPVVGRGTPMIDTPIPGGWLGDVFTASSEGAPVPANKAAAVAAETNGHTAAAVPEAGQDGNVTFEAVEVVEAPKTADAPRVNGNGALNSESKGEGKTEGVEPPSVPPKDAPSPTRLVSTPSIPLTPSSPSTVPGTRAAPGTPVPSAPSTPKKEKSHFFPRSMSGNGSRRSVSISGSVGGTPAKGHGEGSEAEGTPGSTTSSIRKKRKSFFGKIKGIFHEMEKK